MKGETATSPEAQDINNRIEAALFGSDDEPDNNSDDVVSDDVDKVAAALDNEEIDDDEQLPDDDDTDSDEEEGSDELEDIASDEELSLADFLGIPEENLLLNEEGAVSFKAVIDGEEQIVPLSELPKSFQMQGHVNNKSIALEKERKEFQEQRENETREIQVRLQGLEKLTEMSENELLADYNAVNWDELRRVKPAEWTALRQEFAEKANRIKQAKALVAEESDRVVEQQTKEFVATRSKILKEELDKTIAANPAWADPNVRKADQEKMRVFLNTTYGYTDEDFATVMDSRLISLIQDAQKFRTGKEQVKEKLQKAVPKFRKPGANRKSSASLAKARKTKDLRKAVKDNGSISNVANLLVDRM